MLLKNLIAWNFFLVRWIPQTLLREVQTLSCYQTQIYCFFGIEFSYSPSSEWPNLQAGDTFTFPSTPNYNLVNDACFSNVTACILCANFNNFNEASSGLFETGKNVADINNLVNPSARLTSTSYAYDNSVDASTCLTSASTKVNVNISNVININKYSSLNNLLCITCWVMKAKAKFVGKINKNKKGISDQRNDQWVV